MKKIATSLSIFLYCLFPFLNGQEVALNSGSNLSVEEAKAALDFHNTVREEVGVGPLEWSIELAIHAQNWADHLAHSKACKMEHRPTTGEWKTEFGENIYWSSRKEEINHALKATELWYSEKKDFKNEVLNSTNWYATGHYSQMVWSKTQQVGMGFSVCKDGSVLVVANYNPPGNYTGERAY